MINYFIIQYLSFKILFMLNLGEKEGNKIRVKEIKKTKKNKKKIKKKLKNKKKK